MGRREKKAKSVKPREESEEDEQTNSFLVASPSDDDDAEANEDLSLKIVQKAMLRAGTTTTDSPSEVVTNLMNESRTKKRKKKTQKLDEPTELDTNFQEFCGDLSKEEGLELGDMGEVTKHKEVDNKVDEAKPIETPDNIVLRKLLRGPRYFDPPDSGWGTCYNCGEEGHTTVNCTSARRQKPCFVCGSLEHNARQCLKGQDCFICKKGGHRAKDCPEKSRGASQSSKLCLKCGDSGHDMFSCWKDYFEDDLKQIQCYACGKLGHLCCVDYADSGPKEVSCYRCGLLGHTGLACAGSRGEASGTGTPSSCYRCGEEGHFARECTNSTRVGRRNRELSTPKRKSSSESRHNLQFGSAPHDIGRERKKKSHYDGFKSSSKSKQKGGSITDDPWGSSNNKGKASKVKQRGGWITDDPGDTCDSRGNTQRWRSPATPNSKRAAISGQYSYGHTPVSSSSKKSRKLNFSNSPSNAPQKFYPHVYSASRFGNSSYGATNRHYDW